MYSISQQLKQALRHELETDILPFWCDKMPDVTHGGFLGRIDGNGLPHPKAAKGAILNARILWTFSAAYRVTKNTKWLQTADRALLYIREHFIDHEYGGVYWSLNADGTPLDTKKQTYAIGFAIYGLSEYARATGDLQALDDAISLFHDIERHAFDSINNGYIEALTRTWQPIDDMRLSDKDENASRTMNTHLHIIEPYTNLLRCLNELFSGSAIPSDPAYRHAKQEVRNATINLLHIFTTKIINQTTFHLDLFFNDQWKGQRNVQSFGHDIEAAWLLHETALVIGDSTIIAQTEPIVKKIAKAAEEGMQPDGSLIYEHWTDTGKTDRQRQWWVMCENVIGHVDLYQYFGDGQALDTAWRCWQYIDSHLVDKKQGEWVWGTDDEGHVDRNEDKAGFWKCPYHNGRMCLEIIERKF